jgi:hypothetical protein
MELTLFLWWLPGLRNTKDRIPVLFGIVGLLAMSDCMFIEDNGRFSKRAFKTTCGL